MIGRSNIKNKARRVYLIIDTIFSLIDFSCCIEVFLASNNIDISYEIIYSSQNGGVIQSNAGPTVQTEPLAMLEPERGDIVIVIGGSAAPRRSVAAMSAWFRTYAASCRLCGIGAGGDLLLHSLALDASMPEGQAAEHAQKNPTPVHNVAQRVGPVWTCQGKTAALDMMLTLVAEDHGNPHAFRVAEALFMYIWRRPDEPLRSLIFDLQGRGGARFDRLHDHIRMNLAEDLRVERLAELCGMTPRTFARLYLRETGMTPAAAVARIRLEAARTLVEWHGMTLERISHLTGFGSEPSLRRAFLSAFGKLPNAVRDEH